MENLQFFNFKDQAVKVLLDENGEPWFVASDITKILGYSSGRESIINHCNSAGVSKQDIGVQTGFKKDGSPSIQLIKATIINEPNLYRLIIKSTRPEAAPFERWVFEEVLPSIRKHGAFLTKEKTEELLSDPDLIIGIATKLKEERQEKERLQQITDLQQKELKAAAPKLEYFNKVITSTSTYLTDQIAKELGMTAIKLNKKLYSMEVQFKRGEQWVLTAKYADKKYTETRTHPFTKSDGTQGTSLQTVWTEKGRSFIHWLMNKDLSFSKGNQSAANL